MQLNKTLKLAAFTAALTLATGIAQAGQLLFDFSNPTPSISVNTVNGSGGDRKSVV